MHSSSHFLRPSRFHHVLAWALTCLLSVTPGCVGTLANLMHVAHGNLMPASYTGLKEKRIAVVCVSNSEAFGPTTASIQLARQVGQLLETNVDKVQIIDPQRIADWIDRNDWDYINYPEVGKGVNADMVVAIDLDSFSLNDGKTLYRGRADVKVVVYDMTNGGKEVFAYTPTQVVFPENSALHATDMTEEAFRRQFLNVLASRIGRQFYSYDAKEDFARDASVVHSS